MSENDMANFGDILDGLLERRFRKSDWQRVRQYLNQLERSLASGDRVALESLREQLENVGVNLTVSAPWRDQQEPALTGRPPATPVPPDIEVLINRMRPSVLALQIKSDTHDESSNEDH